MNKNYLFLTVILSFFISHSIQAQNFIGTPVEIQQVKSLNQAIKKYEVFSIDALALSRYVHSANYNDELHLKFGDKDWNMILYRDDIRTHNYLVKTTSTNGMVEQPRVKNITYAGYIKNNGNSDIRLTIDKDFIFGTIKLGDEEYFIEPANYFSNSYDKNSFIIYNVEDVNDNPNTKCGVTEVQSFKEKHNHDHSSKQLSLAAVECNEVKIAILTDHLYYLDKGSSVSNVMNRTIAVMNAVNTDYDDPFSEKIKFTIVEQIIVTSAAQNPLTNSADANDVLDSFTSWGNSNAPGDGFTNQFDLGQFWTSRDLTAVINGQTESGVVGLAWIGVVCTSSNNYHILEDRLGTAPVGFGLRVLTSHEIGHNFDANHDASGSSFIMSPSVNSTSNWSNLSVNTINTHLNGISCLAPYFKILSAQPINCGNGNYDLRVVVEHDGGGTSMDVSADGTTQNFSFTASPQTVVLTGLTTNGTANQTVSVDEISSSVNDCSANASYQEPSNNCVGTIFDETFNDCASASHGGQWAITSGETSSFTYQFGLNTNTQNYSVGNFDGSCYAYLDDDITGSSAFTGTSMMTSPVIDLSEYNDVSLTFDYNFHNFEDAKPANNSQFDVEVFNGTAWINVLPDNNDDPNCIFDNVWSTGNNCITSFNVNLNPYLNSDFQMRYIYTDGGTGQWTGMIAIDNITIDADIYTGGGCTELSYYLDSDGDTFGAGAPSLHCTGNQPANFVLDNTDCDDSNGNIFPGATEICDGEDNNCNNQTDEGFDPDNDGIASCFDNCPNDNNPNQEDQNNNGIGDACECAPNLPNVLSVNDDPISNGDYEANIEVNSTGRAPNNSDITFKAGNEVILSLGFVAEEGSDFLAKIDDCGNGPAPLVSGETENLNQTDIDDNAIIANQETSTGQLEMNIFPNPFENETNLVFDLPKSSTVNLMIFDATGQVRKVILSNQDQAKGKHQFTINASDLPLGVYLISLQTKDDNMTKRIIVLK